VTDVAELPRAEIVPAETGTDLSTAVAKEPGIVLLDRAKFTAWYKKLAADAPKDVDISTRKGRESLRSYAADIRSKKAAIDKDRLRLTEQWRDMVSQANAAGKEIKEQLEALAVEVRAPLTEWEEAEKAREAEVEKIIAMFRSERFVPMGEASDSIRERGTVIHNIAIDPDVFQDRADEAEREKKDTVAHLLAAMEQAIQTEKAAEELERLRKAEAERQAAEQAKREAEEAETRRIEEEKRREEARIAAEKAEQERIARAEQEAADRARREAEEAAQRERDEERRQHEAALAAEREAREKAEREAQAERDRIAREQREREEQAARDAAEAAERQANQENRTARKTAAKEAIIAVGIPEAKAIKLVQAIVAGDVPHVKMEF
jgi:hypothetical protein